MRDRKNPRERFGRQRLNAKWRGIPFRLTFEQWWNLWQKSGKWDQMGTRKGQFCMARYADKGAYEIGNVRISLVSDNHVERTNNWPMIAWDRSRWTPEQIAHQKAAVIKALKGIPRSAETRAKVSAAKMGVPLSAAHKASMSAAFKGRHWAIQDGKRAWL